MTETSKEIMWLQFFLEESGNKYERNVLHWDSQSAINLAKHLVYNARTKHIQVRYHLIKSTLEDGVLTHENIQGTQNPTNLLTKIMTIKKLKLCSTFGLLY